MLLINEDMENSIPWKIIKKQLKGEINPQEENELHMWINASEANNLIYEEIMLDGSLKQDIVKGKWENINQEWYSFRDSLKPAKPKLIITKSLFYTVSGFAACILVILSIGFGLYYNRYNNEISMNSSGTYYVYSPRGQRTHVVLPDKSSVWLNAESSLEYSVAYNRENREVTLKGEAFFEVSKNPEKPFIVNAADTRVKAYGTKFNVKAYPTEKYVEAILIEGSIGISRKTDSNREDKEIFLKPKEKYRYENPAFIEKEEMIQPRDSILYQKSVIDSSLVKPKILVDKIENAERETLWKDGKISFNNETFAELAIKMERWFDIKIHFEDEELKNFRFTGQFNNETINQAFDALKLASQNKCFYKIEFRDVKIFLNKKK